MKCIYLPADGEEIPVIEPLSMDNSDDDEEEQEVVGLGPGGLQVPTDNKAVHFTFSKNDGQARLLTDSIKEKDMSL